MPPASTQLKEAGRLIGEKQFDAAIHILLSLLAEDDASPVFHETIGIAYFRAGCTAEAAHHFERLTRLVPQPGRALINLGAVYNRTGEYQKAIDTIRRGLHYETHSADGYYNLGIAYKGLKQLSLAITAYREAIRHNPTLADAYQNLGNALLEQGQAELAEKEFQKALKLKPKFGRAQRGLTEAQQAIAAAREGRQARIRPAAGSGKQLAREGGPRMLTPEERSFDRQKLHEYATEIDVAAHSWLYLLKNDLNRTLRQIEKQVSLGNGNEVAPLVDEFTSAGQKAEEGRRRLRRKVLELVAHEEMQHSPP